MADQTDIAVTAGFIAAPASAIAFQKFTDLTRWISYPLGAIAGAIIVSVVVYLLIGILAKIVAKGNGDE